MQRLEVLGANKLKGQINISGSKNASLPILAATLLSKNKITLKNLPKVKDIETMINLLQSLGSITKFTKQSLVIDNSKQKKVFASYNLVKTMRAGILVLGPLLAKFGNAKVSLPGGCAIGTRPVDIHLKALSKLGVKFKILNGYVHANAPKGLIGTNISFSKISVGATENLIIAACFAKGKTILKNCAIEPEIKDLTNFLNCAGAKIIWKGRTCLITGVNSLNETNYSVMADRIETGTFCVAATIAKGDLEIQNLNPKVIKTELNILKKAGAKIKVYENKIFIKGPKVIKPIKNIKTKEWPGIATDMQSQLMVLMCKANGESSITENIFENRFLHASELQRLGAKIKIINNKATIQGNTKFIGAELMSSDLRASVALVLAAMVSRGKSIINRIYHLDRGYENIEKKLRKIGVKIKRLK